MPGNHDTRKAAFALGLMAFLGVALIFLFPGSPEQDSGYHFEMARSAWHQPVYFVQVWARPFYTAVFAGPAVFGLEAARLFAVAIGLAMAWQSWRLALDLKLSRAWLVVPLLLAQPSFFELYPDLLTEPLFALVFVIAVRWHLRGWIKRGMLAASLLPLARPEGVFLCLLWGLWVLMPAWKSRGEGSWLNILRSPLPLLASGVFLWWLAALAITGDPLFILHNWPNQWQQGIYGRGSLLSYAGRSWEFAGPLLLLPLLAGLWKSLRPQVWLPVTSSWLLFFVLHSLFRKYGLFGEAGYPRYMVSVAPATAVLTLAGWNWLAGTFRKWPSRAGAALGAAVLSVSITISFLYFDSLIWSRDIVAIREMRDWAAQNETRPVNRFLWCNVAMCGTRNTDDFSVNHTLTASREKNLATLRESAPGTLVMWDDKIGPAWFGMTAEDVQSAGYQLLRRHQYALPGVILRGNIAGWKMTREVELTLLYKP
jgi:hypothetical protein